MPFTTVPVPSSIIDVDTKAVSTKSDETRKKIIDPFQTGYGFGVIIMSPVADVVQAFDIMKEKRLL